MNRSHWSELPASEPPALPRAQMHDRRVPRNRHCCPAQTRRFAPEGYITGVVGSNQGPEAAVLAGDSHPRPRATVPSRFPAPNRPSIWWGNEHLWGNPPYNPADPHNTNFSGVSRVLSSSLDRGETRGSTKPRSSEAHRKTSSPIISILQRSHCRRLARWEIPGRAPLQAKPPGSSMQHFRERFKRAE